MLQPPDSLWAEENVIIRLPDNPEELAEVMANSNWRDRLVGLARKVHRKILLVVRGNDGTEQNLSLSYPPKLLGTPHPRLTGPEGAFREFKFSDYFRQEKSHFGLSAEHPLQAMLGIFVVILGAWFLGTIAVATLHALAYIVLFALCVGVVVWGVSRFGKAVIELLARAGVPMENLDHFKNFFQWRKDQFKHFFEHKKLDWNSKRTA